MQLETERIAEISRSWHEMTIVRRVRNSKSKLLESLKIYIIS